MFTPLFFAAVFERPIVTAWFCQMRDEFKIDAFKVGYDRALAGYWVDEMKSNGFDMCAVAQGPFTWSL